MIATIHGQEDQEIDFAPNIEKICQKANDQKHALDFYKDEMIFLNKLINKYFYDYAESFDNTILQIQSLAFQLIETQRRRTALNVKYLGHLHNCLDSIEEFMIEEYVSVHLEHAILSREFNEFEKSYQLMKKEIFSVAEQVMHLEHEQHLLNAGSS